VTIVATFKVRDGVVVVANWRDPAARKRERAYRVRKRLCVWCRAKLDPTDKQRCAACTRKAAAAHKAYRPREPRRKRATPAAKRRRHRKEYERKRMVQHCVHRGCKRDAHGASIWCAEHDAVHRKASLKSWRAKYAPWRLNLWRNIAAVFIHVLNGGVRIPPRARVVVASSYHPRRSKS